MKRAFAIIYTAFLFLTTTFIVVVVPFYVPDLNTNKVILLGILGIMGYLSTFLLAFSIKEGYIK
jgi:hypothetical protein